MYSEAQSECRRNCHAAFAVPAGGMDLSKMSRRTAIVMVVVVGAIAAGTAIEAWHAAKGSATPVRPLMAQTQSPAPRPAPATTPGVRYAIESPSTPAQKPLPALDASDEAVGNGLSKILGGTALPAYFYPEKMIRRFVATIDNLLRKGPVRVMPIKPVSGAFSVNAGGPGLTIDPANSARYGRYIDLMQTVDVPGLVDLYVHFYPLFQQAYRELGYPRGVFNDRLIQALDDLLDAPRVAAPVGLVQPKVLYLFADADLEGRSAGQKLMIRMGGANEARAKEVLRAIHNEVVRRSAAR